MAAPADDERDRMLKFGAYAIEDRIGQGSFSTVYRAELQGQFGFRKQVALKVFRRRLASPDEPVSNAFLNEARLGASIRHTNLVEFYECGRFSDRLFIAMELIEGPDLGDVLREVRLARRPLDREAVLALAMQVALGLRALHGARVDGQRMDVVHQDLKPGNVLLSPHGQAKITDYGIARFAADFYEAEPDAGPRGSPLYMSPEQACGEELGQSSDVFSFGVTLLELINGVPAFAAPTVAEVLGRVREADVSQALMDARARIPEVAPVLEGCLLPDPGLRLPNGAALVEALREIRPPEFAEEIIASLVTDLRPAAIAAVGTSEQTAMEPFWNPFEDDIRGTVTVQLRSPGATTAGVARTMDIGDPEPARLAPGATLTGEGAATAGVESLELPRSDAMRHGPIGLLALFAVLLLLLLWSPLGWFGSALFTDEAAAEDTPTAPQPVAEPAGTAPLAGITITDEIDDGLADEAGAVRGEVSPVTADGSRLATDGLRPTADGQRPTADGSRPTADGLRPTADGSRPTDHDARPAQQPPKTDGPHPSAVNDPRPSPARASEPAEREPRVDEHDADALASTAHVDVDAAAPVPSAPPPPSLIHTPARRGIRGTAIPLSLEVSAGADQRVSVWYRAGTDGPWQVHGAAAGGGAVRLSIPPGSWCPPDVSEVHYFLEVVGPAGTSHSGSAGAPHVLRLF